MKSIFILSFSLFINITVLAQKSTEILPNSITLPRLSTIEQNTVPPQQAGNIIYNADEKKLALHDGTNWNYLATTSSNTRFGFENTLVATWNDTWTVPSNVSKILVELWGGGADGEMLNTVGADFSCSGGGGGEYAKYLLSVTPNEILKMVVSNRTNLETYTSLIRGTNTIIAYATRATGLYGAIRNFNSQAEQVGLIEFQGGENGSFAEMSFQSVNSTTWRKIIKTGNGGGTYPAYKNGGKSLSLEFDVNSGSLIGKSTPYFIDGNLPGGGGGCSSTVGFGSMGMIVIHY